MDENVSFTEFCEVMGIEPGFFLERMEIFAEAMGQNEWRQFPEGAEEKMNRLLEIARLDLSMPIELLNIAYAIAELSNACDNEEEIEGLDAFPPHIQVLVGLATKVAEAACVDKISACKENKGPSPLPGVIYYMTPVKGIQTKPTSFDTFTNGEYQVHAVEAYIDHDSDDPMSDIREKLGEAFEHLGAPFILALACDTYVKEFSNPEEAYAAADDIQRIEKDFLTFPESDVARAMCTVVQTAGEPVVTTTNKYKYDDAGMPVFVECKYAVNTMSDIGFDLSDRGQVCRIFEQFLALEA